MASEPGKASPARQQTDDSLKHERENTDRMLVERQAAVEGDADRVVDKAREHADARLHAARDEADQRLDRPTSAEGRATLTEDRLVEDRVLHDERVMEDEQLRLEREENARILSTLLPLERDATDRYLLTERVHSDDLVANRDHFLAIVSHDLRDLLGAIVMTTGRFAKGALDDERGRESRETAERIQRYAARINRLIGDLVDVASIDAGKLAVNVQRGDAGAVIAEAVDTFQAAASAQGLTLTMHVGERPLLAEFDYYRMLQVLANLIGNAIKFTPAGGEIRVAGVRAQAMLHFSVNDSGSGIPADMLDRIFERFRQVRENDRRGLGLGLYISKHIVQAHGGRMWAESTLGKGSIMHFTLPCPDDRRQAHSA